MTRLRSLLFLIGIAANNGAMHLQTTIGTGQWPMECTPALLHRHQGGGAEIVAVNRGGQLLLWHADGKPAGPGQDGMVCQLGEGQWTSTPVIITMAKTFAVALCSVEGQVVLLDESFAVKWRCELGNKTAWGKAIPAVLVTDQGTNLLLADQGGVITCLDLNGKRVWEKTLGQGPCQALIAVQRNSFLAASGGTLFCLDVGGNVLWRRSLGSEITAQPMEITTGDSRLIVCGGKDSRITALTLNGEILWQSGIHQEATTYLSLLPRRSRTPLIVCSGLWGSVNAFNLQGRHLWAHSFRSKNRSRPVAYDVDGDGDYEVVLSAYNQHLYAFDENGQMVDDVRLAGGLVDSPLPLKDRSTGKTDLLVIGVNLMAFRLRPGPPVSPYGASASADSVQIQFHPESISVINPNGSLLRVNVFNQDQEGCTKVSGCITARSRCEVSFPRKDGHEGLVTAVLIDANGRQLKRREAQPQPQLLVQSVADRLRLWPVPAFSSFDPTCLFPDPRLDSTRFNDIKPPPLYGDEVDQAACVIASSFSEPVQALFSLSQLTTAAGALFSGKIIARQVVSTGSFNGEMIADALPALPQGAILTIPAFRAVKLWLSVDSRGAEPGVYSGTVSVTPLDAKQNSITLPFNVEILSWHIAPRDVLPLCTWDYVPNKWFPQPESALEDMNRHGVRIFPRSVCPTAMVDSLDQLIMDWSKLDSELERLRGRGMILFQFVHPSITFARQVDARKKRRFEIQYLHAFRDRLKQHNLSYDDYAFYPLDEPGLQYGKNVPILLDAAQLYREADARLRIYTDPVPGLSWQDFQRIEPLIDVWCPNMRLVSGLLVADPRMQRIKVSGKPVWSYECVAQTKSLSPLRYHRANAWRAEFFGLDAIGFWTHSTQPYNLWLTPETLDDEYALVYPGEEPVPSIRWEAVRDGLEDIAAFKGLQRQIQRARQKGAPCELIARAEKILRIALVDIMELSDAAFVETRDYLQKGDRLLWHTSVDAEIYEHHRRFIAEMTDRLANAIEKQ